MTLWTVLASAIALADPVAYPRNPALTHDGVVIADDGVSYFDQRTRALRWQTLLRLQTDAPTLSEDRLFVGTSRGLFAVGLTRGRILWHLASEERLFSPLLVGDRIYVSGEDGSLRCLSATGGELLWERRFSGWIYPPAVSGDLLLIAGRTHRLFALAAGDGALVWQRPLPHEPVFRPVAVNDDRIIVTTFTADVLAFDPRSADLHWSERDSTANFSPQIHGDRLYFRSIDGDLRVRRSEDGALLWKASLDGYSQHPLVFHGGRVLALDGEARLHIYDIHTGAPVTDAPSLADGNSLLGSFEGHAVILPVFDKVASRSSRSSARPPAVRPTEERKQ